MRVLITGADGQVGRELVEAFTANEGHYQVHGLTRADLDITVADQVHKVVADLRPQVVINSAAWTQVDTAEAEPNATERVNSDAVAYLVEAADTVGSHFVQISTDYVFSGAATEPYRETDAPSPQSVYGRTKLGGEIEVISHFFISKEPSPKCPEAGGLAALVVRTSWVFGRYGHNILKTVLAMAEAGQPMYFVDDQIGSPTCARDLALTIRSLVEQDITGIMHVTNGEAMSWYEYVRRILELAGYDPNLVNPIRTYEIMPPRAAPRPAYSVLSTERLARLADVNSDVVLPRPLDDAIAEVIAYVRSETPQS